MSGKRATAGTNIVKPAEISADLLAKLEPLQTEQDRVVLKDQFESTYKLEDYYATRRSKLKEIPNFWFTVLQNDTMLVAACGNHSEDLEALKYIEDIWVTRHKPDPRAFTLEMHFKENPFFSDRVLKKEYKLAKEPSGELVDGIYGSMLDFNPDKDLVPSSQNINWKSDKMNLCKRYPKPVRPEDEDAMDEVTDLGSFFNFFQTKEDEIDLGPHLASEIFTVPIPYFKGEVDDDDDDFEDEDISSSEDDDSEADEIDLERPKKRVKRA
ncbi:hypothetical protein CPB86DRAFT_821535 [Serendipita vermifera]|nr:hypothetical protein CPB86DRAFT_821535 [Serendipita vermifera]